MEFAHEAGADVTGPDNGDFSLSGSSLKVLSAEAFIGESPGAAHATEGQETQKALDENDPFGWAEADIQIAQRVEGYAGEHSGVHEVTDFDEAEIAVDPRELAEKQEPTELQRNDPGPVIADLGLVLLGEFEIEAQLISGPAAGNEHASRQDGEADSASHKSGDALAIGWNPQAPRHCHRSPQPERE